MKRNDRVTRRNAAFVAFALGAALGAPTGVDAQQPQAAATQTAAERDGGDDRIVTPRKSDRDLREKDAAASKEAAPVDWARVRAQLAETRGRDAKFASERAAGAAQSQIAARPRGPGGIRRVDLASMKSAAQAAPSQASLAERARKTRLPILVPAGADVLQTLKVFPLENAYAAHARLADGTEIDMMGTRLRVVGGDPGAVKTRLASRQRSLGRLKDIAAPYVISRHEEGVDLSFSIFNVAYLVTVRCKDPDADPHCTGDNFVGSLVRDLGVLNADAGDGQ